MNNLKIAYAGFFLFVTIFCTAQKPDYTGTVDFSMGGFGTFNYPQKGDSVAVFLNGDQVNFKIYAANEKTNVRSFMVDFGKLPLVNKKEYLSQISPSKSVRTGKFDMKLMKSNAGETHTLFLGHFGEGNSAGLTIMTETGGLRIYDLCVMRLNNGTTKK